MKESEARKNKYRCSDCNEPLEEARSDYYCPVCLFKEAVANRKMGEEKES
jgi:Zn finger protein HypA/HybF involved in hydrogenase expression